jgi:predicted kinase
VSTMRPADVPIVVPEPALVVLAGVAGCGKSTFAARHFSGTEVVSSDRCRALVADDANDQRASADAFRLLHTLVAMRLKRRGLVTVVDATNLRRRDRRPYVRRAQRVGTPVVLVALDVPIGDCIERDRVRSERTVGESELRRQRAALEQSLEQVPEEGFYGAYVLGSEEIIAARIVRTPFQPAEPLPAGHPALPSASEPQMR